MTSIEELKQKLNIEVGDRDIQPGICKPMKNRYYNINNIFLVVEFKNNKYAVFSNDIKTRELLSDRVWYIGPGGYVYNCTVKFFHQNFLNYEQGLVCDHQNRLIYDNRQGNLRVITYQQNMRNRTKNKNNTSGKNGVRFIDTQQSWRAYINNDNGDKISKTFSINRYGDAEAKQMALDQRLAWEEEFEYDGE
jgi:hypothetical protein